MFVSDVSGDHMVETYSSMGLIMALYVARIVSFCFPHVVDVSALSICIVLRVFLVVISICLLYVTGQVGLGVGSWPSNRATEGSNPKGTRLYFVILLKNVEKKSLIGTDITV